MYVLAKLTDDQLETLQDCEQKLDVKVIAMQDVALDAAPLDAGQLAALKELEVQLGMCLVAVV